MSRNHRTGCDGRDPAGSSTPTPGESHPPPEPVYNTNGNLKRDWGVFPPAALAEPSGRPRAGRSSIPGPRDGGGAPGIRHRRSALTSLLAAYPGAPPGLSRGLPWCVLAPSGLSRPILGPVPASPARCPAARYGAARRTQVPPSECGPGPGSPGPGRRGRLGRLGWAGFAFGAELRLGALPGLGAGPGLRVYSVPCRIRQYS